VRVAILVLHNQGTLRSLLDSTIRVITVPGQRLRYAIPGLRRVVRAVAPRAVLSSGTANLPTLVAVRTLPRQERPKLVLREVAVPSMARHDPYKANWISYRILRYLYRCADRIVTLTEGTRRDMRRGLDYTTTRGIVGRPNI
jgi:hypothetical protein